ncbi:MBL fold metallo-hydrolase [Puniceibacterium sp. IMCC21224]|uniref:MBL fold metallo-hydrolase n=1 Tax=Puniceibacterium sp. IMCC21224 TaxID=1618204 RepID=UPI00065CFC3B|nr:metallo-beta-lactamase superfamily enzyme [Puniceibacterium sp. IMCC21224]
MTITRHSPSNGPTSPDVWGLYEEETGSIQYVAACPATGQAALIDVVLDFDPKAASTSTDSAKAVLDLVNREGLEVAMILDTHPHADHMTAAAWLKEETGAPTAIGVNGGDKTGHVAAQK